MINIKLNQKLKRVEVKEFEMENEIVFSYFDSLAVTERDDKFLKAIYIGVLALMEDRLSSFLAKTSNELGTELESLKLIFDMKQELFYKSAIKGNLAEEDVALFLEEFIEARKLKDTVLLTGNTSGELPKNKTGDIVCKLDDENETKIVIECKFDKSVRLGDIQSKNIFTKKQDTAWSQLIESEINRNAQSSIIVFDKSLIDNSILKQVENVGYIPAIGLIAIIDSQKGDYTNLGIAYMLARDIALHSKNIELDQNILSILLNRVLINLHEISKIKQLVQSNIDTNKEILKQIEKAILLVQFDLKYIDKFFKDGTLTKSDLLAFYTGEQVNKEFNLIQDEIEELTKT